MGALTKLPLSTQSTTGPEKLGSLPPATPMPPTTPMPNGTPSPHMGAESPYPADATLSSSPEAKTGSWNADDLSMVILPGSLEMTVGQVENWSFEVLLKGQSSPQGIWSSSDEGVAKVNERGQVVAMGVGKALIRLHWPPDPKRFASVQLDVAAYKPLAAIPEVATQEAPRGFRWVEGKALDALNGKGIAGAWLMVDDKALGQTDTNGRFRVALRPGPHRMQLHLAPRYPLGSHGWEQEVNVRDLIEPLDLGPLAMKRKNWLPLLRLAPDAGSVMKLVGKQELWVGTQGGLLHRSTDGGASWTAYDVGLKAGIADMFIEGERWRWVLSQDGSIVRSRDGGQSWNSIRPAQEDGGLGLWVEGESKLWVLGKQGLKYSNDAGESWRNLLFGRFEKGTMVVKSEARTLLVVGPNGSMISSNNGDEWSQEAKAIAPAYWDTEAKNLVLSEAGSRRFLHWDAGEKSFKRYAEEGWPLSLLESEEGAQVVGLPRFISDTQGWRLKPEALEAF